MASEDKKARERRRHPRVELEMPVQVFKGEELVLRGRTVNVSTSGILAKGEDHVRNVPAEGENVIVGFGIPGEGEEDSRAEARVVRASIESESHCAFEFPQPPRFLHAPILVGKHQSMIDLKERIARLAEHPVNIFLHGESGSGKNVAAKALHYCSELKDDPFVRVNCPSIPDTLFESYLFGSEKGAYTGANAARPGLFRIANGGTILLDEISAIPSNMQAKLLRVIEEKEFLPVGAHESVKVDVRIIATSNADMNKRVREGGFRHDLFYRIAEVSLRVPPLRDRPSDIPLLADHFVRKYCDEYDMEYRPLDRETLETFRRYPWPGNVRELENTIKRGLLLGQFRLGEEGSLETSLGAGAESNGGNHNRQDFPSLKRVRRMVEKRAIENALNWAERDKERAAAALGVSYRTLQRKLRDYSRDNGENGMGELREELTRIAELGDIDNGAKSLDRIAEKAEEKTIARALDAADGDRTRAAALLDVSYRTLLRKTKKYGLT